MPPMRSNTRLRRMRGGAPYDSSDNRRRDERAEPVDGELEAPVRIGWYEMVTTANRATMAMETGRE
jgi:hypothetical protein